MALNTIALAAIFQTALDKQVVASATSGWMEGNAGLVQYNGGKTIKIPKIVMDGLGNYDRANGYVDGSVTFDYETMTFTQDRGRRFSIDAMDVDETNFVATATTLMTEFQRTQVIPEIDAYRYSMIATLAIAAKQALGGYTPTVTDVFSKLRADIATVQDVSGEVPLIISMPIPIKSMLEGSSELAKQLDIIDFASADGSISLKLRALDGCPIIGVPSSRMKTAYVLNDGTTTGQTAGGFVAATTAKTINWTITAQDAPIGVSKTAKMRIFDPDTNQKADGWQTDYRKYHDLWIGDNALEKVFVNIKESLT